MRDEIHSELKEIEKLARSENYHEALRRADALAARYPDDPGIWAARGYVNGRQGDLPAAISDLSRCIDLGGNEPDDFFTRGRFLFKAGRYAEAALDFTRVLQLCDSYNSDYYRQAAYFFRADAYVRLSQYDKARADCCRVVDRGPIWTDKLRTIDDIMDECR
jgi:tetratricopeptide (TPR) repeat protein